MIAQHDDWFVCGVGRVIERVRRQAAILGEHLPDDRVGDPGRHLWVRLVLRDQTHSAEHLEHLTEHLGSLVRDDAEL